MNKFFLILSTLIFLLSCEKNPSSSSPIWGCMDSTACNYNVDANRNDDSCLYQSDFFDCDGFCIAETSDGCECGEILDECNNCNGLGCLLYTSPSPRDS